MISVEENALEWALKHLKRYYDSDFYPKSFEYDAISHNWPLVKKHILSLDLLNYIPKSPLISLSPKVNGTYRIVHQLDPIDSLIYTALVYQLHNIIEEFRIPETEKIACSYRVKPDLNGSFFQRGDDGWKNYKTQIKKLAKQYKRGFVLFCDITDFYNQIYTHRIRNIISEAGGPLYNDLAKILEDFLMNLNTKTSRGIPVGPAASIVLAEAIMADIDKKILSYTRDFVRWVDDIIIFFNKEEDASFIFHELTKYLYSSHRLVFSGEKSRIKSVQWYMKYKYKDEEQEEEIEVMKKTEELANEKFEELELEFTGSTYDYFEDSEDTYEEAYENIYNEVAENEHFEILTDAYKNMLNKELDSKKLDVALLRHIFRNASRYRIRSLAPIVLRNFEALIPLIREVVIYLNKTLSEPQVKRYKRYFEKILDSHIMDIPFINVWVSYLLQNNHFNIIDFPQNYKKIIRIREQALIAKRRNDRVWVKDHKDGLDVLGPLDRRSVLYSAEILSEDEMKHWIKMVSSRGDIIDKSICALLSK
ncbi:MAG: RNA-directed DNA polymerase [Nitrospirota bacterium]